MSTPVPYVRPRILITAVISGLLALTAMTVYAVSRIAMTQPEAIWLIIFAVVGGGMYLALECRNSLAAKRSEGPSV